MVHTRALETERDVIELRIELALERFALRVEAQLGSGVTVVLGDTLLVIHTLDPITESRPITVRPPRIVALA